jgi:cytochrome P450
MSRPDYQSKGDFLTLMLSDELFKGQDTYMIDECLTFMLAATMTTTLLISNAIYYLTANKDKLERLRSEMLTQLKRENF